MRATPEMFRTMWAQQLPPQFLSARAALTIERFRVIIDTAGPAQLSDGTLGYFVRWPRGDDCWAAAVATCLQIPIAEVPDARIDERRVLKGWSVERVGRTMAREFDVFLGRRGLRMIVHRKLPALRRRWIGVVDHPGPFQSHCLIMSGDRFLFDPTRFCDHISGLEEMPAMQQYATSEISYGLSFSTL